MKISLIIYGTLTGNTQMVAMWLAETLGGVECLSFEEVSRDKLPKDGVIVCGVSTWGEGDFNPQTEDFVIKIQEEEWDLKGYKFALFGMGDSSYEKFCGAVDKLALAIKVLGGEIIGEIHKIDGFMDEEKEKELKKWVAYRA